MKASSNSTDDSSPEIQMLSKPETENKKGVKAATAFARAAFSSGYSLLPGGPPPP